MPSYAYKCPNCGHEKTVVKPLAALNDRVVCEHEYEHAVYGRVTCMGHMERQATAANFVVKGFNTGNGYSKG